MRSDAATVADYLKELDPERQKLVRSVRTLVKKHVPKGIKEVMNWGMISYEVPLKHCPDTYNGQPLMYAALASQKRNCSLYIMNLYCRDSIEADLRGLYQQAGLKLDMGKCCIRFKSYEQLLPQAIGQVLEATTMQEFIEHYKETRGSR